MKNKSYKFISVLLSLALLLGVSAIAIPVHATVTVDTTGGINATPANGSQAVTIGNNPNRALVVFGYDNLSGAQFNGVSPTFQYSPSTGNNFIVFLNPATGTHNFTWSAGGSGGYQSILSVYNVTYQGVYTFGTNTGNSNTSSLTGTTHEANNMVLTTTSFSSSGVVPTAISGQSAMNGTTASASARIALTGVVTPTLQYTNGGTSTSWSTAGIELVEVILSTVTTQAITTLDGGFPVVGNGNLTSDGGATVTERGFVYDTASHSLPGNVDPLTTAYTKVSSETGTFSAGAYSQRIFDMANGTQYYMRAYTKNSIGWSYGNEVNFTTNYQTSFMGSD